MAKVHQIGSGGNRNVSRGSKGGSAPSGGKAATAGGASNKTQTPGRAKQIGSGPTSLTGTPSDGNKSGYRQSMTPMPKNTPAG